MLTGVVQKAGMVMGHTIKLAALGAVAFMVLDGIWLGLLMKNFYRDQLAPISRLMPARPTVTSPIRTLSPSKVAMI